MADRYAVISETSGEVVNVIVWDGETQFDLEKGMVLVSTDVAGPGWSYVGGEFLAPPEPEVPPPTPEQAIANNTAERDRLLAAATLAIAPLQDAVDLDEATAEDIATLKKWKQYRVAVNRIDLTLESPGWPLAPA